MKVCFQQTDHREAVGFNRTALNAAICVTDCGKQSGNSSARVDNVVLLRTA
jgi:hypothetical protein